MSGRVRSWHDCLCKLLLENGPVSPELGKRFRTGQGVHRAIEGMFPGTASEKRGRFVDDTLPFAIDYHPDIWDRAESKVWEIKPLGGSTATTTTASPNFRATGTSHEPP